ncbi:hypothetical protein HMPREF1872_01210 [Amygdalobacter nucleatus]|uniref:Uncharacterized protein n=1 Tax=Amygdalobacter nucleatus TaxID=3029274 RepID=A0A133Y7I3_9FIRM|nr:hypothetical protein HMPREF1872_01210 [Amygdalobacter nucleatus]
MFINWKEFTPTFLTQTIIVVYGVVLASVTIYILFKHQTA